MRKVNADIMDQAMTAKFDPWVKFSEDKYVPSFIMTSTVTSNTVFLFLCFFNGGGWGMESTLVPSRKAKKGHIFSFY